MREITLGLPLEYQKYPQYFDAHNVNDEIESKNQVIERILKEHKVKSVLDFTCGTGSQVFYLAQRGYDIIGVDFSPALLKIAREKAVQQNLDLAFIDGDMRDTQVGKFDAIITIFNAIGHLTKIDFSIALQNIRHNLKTNGLYIFDIFNLNALSDEIVRNFKMDIRKQINNIQIYNTQYSELDPENGLLTSYDRLEIFEKEDAPKIVENKFSLQIYTSKELREIMTLNGFKILHQYDINGLEFVEDKSLSMLTIARSV